MKNIAIHPPSVAIGGAFAITLAVALGAAQVSTQLPPSAPATPKVVPGTAPPLERPFARDLVVIREGVSYTVPAGRWLVLVGLGRDRTDTYAECILTVDGNAYMDLRLSGVDTMQGLGSGLPFMPGQQILVTRSQGSIPSPFAVGYLEDA